MVDLVVRNGWIVSSRETRFGSIAIDKHRIVKIGPDAEMPTTGDSIDAEGRYVIPGLVDMHVHYGITGKEMPYWTRIARDIEVETLGAAYGGMTTHFPMLAEPESYLPVVDELIRHTDEHSYINTSFTVIIQGDHHIDEMPDLCRKGVCTFKHFFNPYKHENFETLTFRPVNEGQLTRSLEKIRELGAPTLAMVHAEDCDMYEYFDGKAQAAGLDGLEGWAAARPNICEYSRVELACMIALEAHSAIHFVHMSCGESIEILQRYMARGLNVSAEVVTANITSTFEDGKDIGVWGKFCPPIRGPKELERLWEGIRAGAIRHVATDHCGYQRAEKEGKGGQFGSIWKVIPGISNGQEHMLPAMVTYGVKTGRISMQDLVALCCENNAKRFGLYPRKGLLAEGCDADIAVVDLSTERKVDENFYHGRGRDHSLFWGRTLAGYVTDTIVRGIPVIRGGKVVGKPGTGKYAPQRAHL
jgi:dihydropyrimidinase/dihydroorotase